jgi:hypothetical protein
MFKFFEHYPFIWGGGITGIELDDTPSTAHQYIEYLKAVAVGDILVAGGTKYIDFFGKITGKPTFIPHKTNKQDASYYEGYGIAQEADAAVVKAFNDFQDSLEDNGMDDMPDMVYIKTQWFDKNKLRFPNNQSLGGFQPLTEKNRDFISSLVGSYK